MNITEQKKAVKAFVEKWSTKEVSERGGYQIFWIELMQNVLGDTNASNRINAEEKVRVDNHTNFIDIYLPDVKVIIEQKKRGIELDVKAKQSDGSCLTPFEQAKKYNDDLRLNEKAAFIITSNFDEIWVYDMNPKIRGVYEPVKILLPEILKYSEFLKNILIKKQTTKIEVEEDISFKAGLIIGKIYNALYKQYEKVFNPLTEEILRDLNKLCVRLVFCFYAEDTDLFPEYNYFQHYMDKVNADKFRKELIDVFETLDTDYTNRDEFIEKALNDFPYVNGGLFEGKIKIPQFDDELKAIVHEASVLHWENISPAIFGAMFESTLNPDTRRTGGMHYTTVENIHKVIDPLFLDDLRQEFEKIKTIKAEKQRNKKLLDFQDKIASLKFLDPACGSGNFLTETYISLRRLENEILKELNKTQRVFGTEGFLQIKVSISQFYGIEINDFAVDVAKAAMWIAENQMLRETLENVALVEAKPLPLNTNDNIVEANALRIDWETVVPKSELNYIMGNPPFVGQAMRTKWQAKEIEEVFAPSKAGGKLDYVAGWFKKATDYISNSSEVKDKRKEQPHIEVAFVSSNSISQGESVNLLWEMLFNQGIKINFAHTSFKWTSEAKDKAGVICVIIGFSFIEKEIKYLFLDKEKKVVKHINGYLNDGPDVFIKNRSKSINKGLATVVQGSPPADDGRLLMTLEEKNKFIEKYPELEKVIKPFIGSREFINDIGYTRFCFWFVGESPANYQHIPELIERFNYIREYRLKSPVDRIQKTADKPFLFTQNRQPKTDYLIIPRVSSEKRKYIPIGFLPPDVIASDSAVLVYNASLFDFGLICSNTHNSWMRTVAGRLKSDYRYAPSVFYNFPFPEISDEKKSKIEQTAQTILDARKLYPNKSLADMYGEQMYLFPELKKAHEANDKAVTQAYGLPKNATEAEIVAYLMNLYKELTSKQG